MKRSVVFLVIFFITQINAASTTSLKDETDFTLKLWVESCVKHSADYQTLDLWARSQNLRKIPEEIAQTMLQGKAGSVWKITHKKTAYFLLLSKTNACSVWAQKTKQDHLNTTFESIMESLPNHPKKKSQNTAQGANGSYQQIAYFSQHEKNSPGWLYIATTTDSPNVPIQTRLTLTQAID